MTPKSGLSGKLPRSYLGETGRVIDSYFPPCYTPRMDNLRKAERERFKQNVRELGRWLAPGLGIKRWFFFVLAGITFIGIGLAILLLSIYRTEFTDQTILTILSYVSLQFVPRTVRVLIFSGIGIGLVSYGIYRLNHSLMRPFIRPGHAVVDELANYRRRERGPRIVTIGGGHGLSTLLPGR